MSRTLVVGGGLDGLAAAGVLARAGVDVELVERLPSLGGLAQSFALEEGGEVPGIVPLGWGLPPIVASELGQEVEALNWINQASLFPAEVSADIRRLGSPLRPMFSCPPTGRGTGLIGTALNIRLKGARAVHRLARILGKSAADWLEELPLDDGTRAAAAASTSCLAPYGPKAPGTAGLLLLKESCSFPVPVGGAAALAKALIVEAEKAGVSFRADSGVESFVVEAGRVVGAVLEGGEEVRADNVLSSLDVASTFLCLMPAGAVPPAVEREVRTFRSRGTAGLVLFSVSGVDDASLRFCSADHLDDLERAADAASLGRLPDTPVLYGNLFQREGEGDVSGLAQVLHLPAPGSYVWDVEGRTLLLEQLRAQLGKALPPGTEVKNAELLVPEDISSRFGIAGGHLFHGEVVPDQWHVLRPGRLLSGFCSPVPGLFSCGRGHHPAGTLGASGWLAARSLLES
ncbi:MAG TPA: hypothetical protein DDW23_05845 [Planctomycetes bacterium]|nr:hypothetical protein [Planctomycetota bacterium]